MAKFCGKCGEKLDEATGLCPKCDMEKIKEKFNQNQLEELTDIKSVKKTRKREKKTQKKAYKKENHEQWSKSKKIRRFFLKFMLAILCLTVLVGVTGVLVYFDVVNIPIISDFKQEHLLEFVNERNIVVEEKNIVMTNETEGVATLIVKIPDYKQLFKEASAAKKPEQYY